MLAESHLQAIICTANLAEAKRFYGEVLELPSKGQSLGAEIFAVGGVALRVSPVPSNRPSEHTVLGFAVKDLERVARWLLAKDVQFERFPRVPIELNSAFFREFRWRGAGLAPGAQGTQLDCRC